LIRIQQMKGNRSRQIRVNHAYLREDLTSWRLYEGERELAVAQFAGMPRRLRTLSGVVAAAPIKLDIENAAAISAAPCVRSAIGTKASALPISRSKPSGG
jgi:hypothetical protein